MNTEANELKPGDEIMVEWTDGLVDYGTFMRVERGYVVFLDKSGRIGALASAHGKVTLIERAIQENRDEHSKLRAQKQQSS